MYTAADYQRGWDERVAQVRDAFSRLSGEELSSLGRLAARLRELKVAMHALVERVDAAAHCAACRGACCASGRYHFRSADLLVYLVTGEPLFAPRFSNGLCPFLDGSRCLMGPAYRPFNCITFNCEVIEDLLPAGDVARFYRFEAELRGVYAELEKALPDSSLRGALLHLAPPPHAVPPDPGAPSGEGASSALR